MNKKELRSKIENQVALEKRAYKHVEKLVLADFISKDEFQEVLNEIMPGHYADIVEERSISKQCGYPLCSNALVKVPRQKFHISVENRQIYDITERKCFCSNKCFKFSKYIESQIPTSPLWLRKDRVIVEFLEDATKQDNNEQKGSTDYRNAVATETERNSLTSLETTTNKNTSDDEKICINSNLTKFESTDFSQNRLDPVNQSDRDYRSNANSSSNISRNRTKLIDLPVNESEKLNEVEVEKLCDLLQEWCTIDTFEYFRTKPIVVSKHEELRPPDANLDETAADNKKRSAEKVLQENREWQSEAYLMEERPLISKAFISPMVDSKSQHGIRRKIVSVKLRHSFSEVFSELCLSFTDYKADLTSLIRTFRFTNQNITLRPKEWKVVATALLHAISTKDKSLEESISKRSREVEQVFNSCGIDKNKCAKLVRILNHHMNKNVQDSDNLDSPNDVYDNESLD